MKYLEPLTKSINDLSTKVSSLETENHDLKQRVNGLMIENKDQQNELHKLKNPPQYTRNDNLIISGVEEENGEDVFEKVFDLAKELDVGLGGSDISACHRLPSRNKDN